MKKAIMLAIIIISFVSGVSGCVRCLVVYAEAALIEYDSGRVLFSQNMHEQLPMASSTKIMTTLLTLEQSGLDIPFSVDNTAVCVEGSSMGLQKGDTVTLRVLAAGMLLASGNDAANAAVRISGSLDRFVNKMNQRAEKLGLSDTLFETPSGLDGENHYSSAYDMAMPAREALSNSDFAELCSSDSMEVEYGSPPYRRWLLNHNGLLNCCDGAVGIKNRLYKESRKMSGFSSTQE